MSDALIQRANGNGADLSGEFKEPPPPATLELEVDVTFHAQHITVLRLKEPTGKQMRRAEQELVSGPNAHTLRMFQMRLIAEVANVPFEVIDQVPVSKLNQAMDFLSLIMDAGRETGRT